MIANVPWSQTKTLQRHDRSEQCEAGARPRCTSAQLRLRRVRRPESHARLGCAKFSQRSECGEDSGSELDEFRPSAVLIGERITSRSAKQTKMLASIKRQARSRRIPVRCISRRDVNRAFVGFESNKYEVASALARQFPDLALRLPPKRKCWQSEDYRMGIFDAAALGVAYFTRSRQRQPK